MNNTSFFEIIANSGSIGILIWLWLFIFNILGIILGIFSIASSAKGSGDKYPAAFKLLICCMLATLFTGAMGTITGYIDTFAGLATATGSEKATMMELSMSQSRVSFYFALGAVFIQLVFAVISWFAFTARFRKNSDSFPSIPEQLRKIPILVYLIILAFIPVIAGIVFSLRGITQMVTLKPNGALPLIMGFDFSVVMYIFFTAGSIGILLSFLLMIRTIICHFFKGKE